MTNIRVSPPFDITHTLIYDTIDNKMALKVANSKVFPDKAHLLKLGEGKTFRIRDCEKIIEAMSDGVIDFLKQSNEVTLFSGLRKSIEQGLSRSVATKYNTKPYRHDRKLKFE